LSSTSPTIQLPEIDGALDTVIQVLDDPTTARAALTGSLDLPTAVFRLTADDFAVDIGGAFSLSGSDGSLVLGPIGSTTDPLFAASTLSFGINLPGAPHVLLDTTDLQVTTSGDVSIESANATFAADELSQTIAGLLPLQVTRIDVAPITTGERLSLRDFDASVSVQGFFNDNVLGGLPFSPQIQIGGVVQDRVPPTRLQRSFDWSMASSDPGN
jgi:hypothetical protein